MVAYILCEGMHVCLWIACDPWQSMPRWKGKASHLAGLEEIVCVVGPCEGVLACAGHAVDGTPCAATCRKWQEPPESPHTPATN